MGKGQASLHEAFENIPGRENVELVALDLSDTYKSFVKGFFPNAKCVADKFHVLRLLHPHINRRRKDVTGDRRTLPIRKLLLVNGKKLDYSRKYALSKWLESYPELREVYSWKERMHGFYRIKGHKRARIAFQRMTDDMAHSLLPEIKRLRRTLMRWREEILLYFRTRLTNARTEGFNNVKDHSRLYGKRKVNGSAVDHKKELRIIETIKGLYEEGIAARAIARTLDTMKIPTKQQGKGWHHHMVITILKREGLYETKCKPRRKK